MERINERRSYIPTNMCILGLLVHIFVDYTMAVKPPYEIIKDFEHALSVYTGAPFVTCVNSCTMALRLCLDWSKEKDYRITKKHQGINLPDFLDKIVIPKHTYVSVPIQITQAGYEVEFEDKDWKGMYRLKPLPIFDSARRFHARMCCEAYDNFDDLGDYYICVSFHYTKILGLGHGGAILHNNPDAALFFQQMRHDGRFDGVPISPIYHQDTTDLRGLLCYPHLLGHHCPMSPEIAAQGLVRLSTLPAYNDDLPNSDYPDLSTFEVFK